MALLYSCYYQLILFQDKEVLRKLDNVFADILKFFTDILVKIGKVATFAVWLVAEVTNYSSQAFERIANCKSAVRRVHAAAGGATVGGIIGTYVGPFGTILGGALGAVIGGFMADVTDP